MSRKFVGNLIEAFGILLGLGAGALTKELFGSYFWGITAGLVVFSFGFYLSRSKKL